ncbi:hypothetical protein ElyMa_005496900 [Elysia marginata]|uniref:SMB domain-containing protein n=1 Tax=Elysia marginata TaxID=1093978 RepID=A0AAV4ESR4_9GAST|nr:hypothetical protein ElyMa_005496900 [Elysia marginata]
MRTQYFMLGIFLFVAVCHSKTSRVTQTRQLTAYPDTLIASAVPVDKTSQTLSTSSLATFYPPSRATIQPDDSDCQDIATDFAYRNNLCAGATSPENYLSVSRSRYSCSMRCGQAPVYRAESSFVQCACDESCMAHKDCCPDMVELCPDQYNLGQSIAYPPNLHEYKRCSEYEAIFKTIDDEEFYFSAAPNVAATPPTLSKNKALPYQQRNLVELTKSLRYHKVVDLTTKLLYTNYASFTAFKTAVSAPYFIPRMARLTCSMPSAAVQGLPKVSEILPWCRVQGLGDSLTLYHRTCKKHYLLTCRCKDGHRLSDHVHNTCIGRNNPQAGQYRYPRWDTQVEKGNSPSFRGKTCTLIRVSPMGTRIYRMRVKPKPTMTMRVTAIINFPQAYSNTDFDGMSMGNETKPQSSQTVSEQDISFMVELTNTLEKRFYCKSLWNYLEECQLEECATGSLLWTEDTLQHTNGPDPGRYCISPKQVKVFTADGSPQIPLCKCLQVLAFLNDFGVWETHLETEVNRKCSINLITPPNTIRYSDEMDGPTEPDVLIKSWRSNQALSSSLFINLSRTSEYCSEEMNQPFRICFVQTPTSNDSRTDVCLTLNGEDALGASGTSGSNLGCAQTMMNCAIVLVIIVYL